jgi:hypothetical protein
VFSTKTLHSSCAIASSLLATLSIFSLQKKKEEECECSAIASTGCNLLQEKPWVQERKIGN